MIINLVARHPCSALWAVGRTSSGANIEENLPGRASDAPIRIERVSFQEFLSYQYDEQCEAKLGSSQCRRVGLGWAYRTMGTSSVFALIGAVISLVVGQPMSAEAETRSRVNDLGCRPIVASDYPPATVQVPSHSDFAKSHYPDRIRQFAKEPLACGGIVMLGDSLTEKHDWSPDLKTEWPARNRGIAGDTSDGLLLRLGEIAASKPRAVFLLIGTNDLWSRNSGKKVAQNIDLATAKIRAGSPQTKVFVQTVFPLRSSPELNSKVRKINKALQMLASDGRYRIVDTYTLMSDSTGLLRAELTTDGVHLNSQGYRLWAELLNSAMERYALRATSSNNTQSR